MVLTLLNFPRGLALEIPSATQVIVLSQDGFESRHFSDRGNSLATQSTCIMAKS